MSETTDQPPVTATEPVAQNAAPTPVAAVPTPTVAEAQAALRAWEATYCYGTAVGKNVTQLNAVRNGVNLILTALNSIKE